MPEAPGFFFKEAGQGPATHALIVGVSDYRFLDETRASSRTFGLVKLNSAALSALRFARWLVDNRARLPRRLASVRLLIAPSQRERDSPLWAEFMLPDYVPLEPDFANFEAAALAWQADATRSEDEVTVFSYTGHGIRVTDSNNVMLLSDFGQPLGKLLKNAVDLSNVWQGMAPSALNPLIAQKQFYFVDACRLSLDEMDQNISLAIAKAIEKGVSTVFDAPDGNDERSWTVLFATSTATKAKSRPGDISFFCEALVDALPNACDQPRREGGHLIYPVRFGLLRQLVQERLRTFGITPKPIVNGQNEDSAEFAHFSQPPTVNVTITLDPDDSVDGAVVTIRNPAGQALPPPIGPSRADHPYPRALPMGIYTLRADLPPDRFFETEPEFVTRANRFFTLALR